MPSFNNFKLQNLSLTEARKQLNIAEETHLLLFFGFIRDYKGLKHLIRAMPSISRRFDNVKLLIVGDFTNESEHDSYLKLIADCGVSKQITVVNGYIPDNEVEKFFAAADVVVLPYESATQSAIAQLAYAFHKPVIATNVGGLPEVVIDGKTGFLVESGNDQQLADAVVRFFSENRAGEFSQNICTENKKYSWDHMVETIEDLWRAVK